MDHKIAIDIRARKLGVLIRDARLEAGESLKACGEALGTNGQTIGKYEKGQKSPSLPELEILAYYLDIPLERFWGKEAHSEIDALADLNHINHRIQLRRRIIGVSLRLAREEAKMTIKEVAKLLGISSYRLSSYEKGKLPLPLPELEALLFIYDIPLDEFKDQKGPIGKWATQKQTLEAFIELSPEMQQFVIQPVNKPYLEIAQKLSGMPVEELRLVAEGLLEITL